MFLNFYAGPAPAAASATPAPPAPPAPPAAPADSGLDPELDPDPAPEEVVILDWVPEEPVSIIFIFSFLYFH